MWLILLNISYIHDQYLSVHSYIGFLKDGGKLKVHCILVTKYLKITPWNSVTSYFLININDFGTQFKAHWLI